jgi:hypothetical protein
VAEFRNPVPGANDVWLSRERQVVANGPSSTSPNWDVHSGPITSSVSEQAVTLDVVAWDPPVAS